MVKGPPPDKLYGKQKKQDKPVPKQKEPEVNYQSAGATLLAMQPAAAKPRKEKFDPEWASLRSHLEANLVSLRMWRQSWWTQNWSNLAEFILPRRSIWLTQSTGGIPTPNNMTRGRPLNNAIKDPTATFAVRICAAGLMSGLASPSRPWYKIVPKSKNFQPDAAGRAWMDEVENRIYTILAGSNFYNSFAQECEDLVVFGTAPSIIYEDEKEIIRCYNPAVGEYYLASGATMRVDGLYRQFVMTVKQMVEFFGLENCPKDIQSLWKQKGASLQMEKIVAHAIEPNYAVEGAGKIPGNFTWREVYWVYGQGSDMPLSKRGFVDCPFTAARWATQSNDSYGRSPGMDVLPDVMQLQVMTVRLSEAIEKQVRPPLVADIAMKNQPSSSLPGHVTYVPNLGAGTGMRSMYEVNPDVKGLAGLIEQIEQRIKVGLFNDLFLMLQQAPDQKMTAYEVAQKVQEKLQVLGPVIENLITESLKPKLKRIFSILVRKDMLPPMPDSMKGVALDVEFISMLALAQKATSTGGIERIVALIGNMLGAYPNIKFILDEEATVREFNDLLANPEVILRGPEDYQKQVQQFQQQQAKEQQMVEAQHAAKTASTGADAAQVLSQTQIGGGATALSQILGTGGPPQ